MQVRGTFAELTSGLKSKAKLAPKKKKRITSIAPQPRANPFGKLQNVVGKALSGKDF